MDGNGPLLVGIGFDVVPNGCIKANVPPFDESHNGCCGDHLGDGRDSVDCLTRRRLLRLRIRHAESLSPFDLPALDDTDGDPWNFLSSMTASTLVEMHSRCDSDRSPCAVHASHTATTQRAVLLILSGGIIGADPQGVGLRTH